MANLKPATDMIRFKRVLIKELIKISDTDGGLIFFYLFYAFICSFCSLASCVPFCVFSY